MSGSQWNSFSQNFGGNTRLEVARRNEIDADLEKLLEVALTASETHPTDAPFDVDE